jgi:uncharacterized protein (DUF4415 family)
MKSDVTSKKFPASPQEWEAIIADAPGEDIPPAPEENAAWANGVVVKEGGFPSVSAALAEKRQFGKAHKSKKELLSVRYSPEVVEYFLATGDGWQTRMDAALKDWIKTHPLA